MKTFEIKVLIIDDERLAREEIKRALVPYADFTVVGEAKNAETAKSAILSLNPDLLFLDIHMPLKSGFELLESLSVVPQVVFTTAYDQYAVKAFEVNALDYLVKPIRSERFEQMILKVRNAMTQGIKNHPKTQHPQNIFIKDGEHCHFIPTTDIHLIESYDNYSRFYFGARNAMLKTSLQHLEHKLDPTLFFRANRQQIFNTTYILKLDPDENGRIRITLKTGHTILISTRQSVVFRRLFSI